LRRIYKDVSSGNVANVARKNLLAAWNWGKKYAESGFEGQCLTNAPSIQPKRTDG